MKKSHCRDARPRSDRSGLALLLAATVLLLVISSAMAWADSSDGELGALPTTSEVAETIESPSAGSVEQKLTDPKAAAGMQLGDLGRAEALEVMTGVFTGQVEAPAGVYDELQEATLLGPHVAVVPDGPEADASEGEAQPEAEAEGVEGHPPSAPAQVSNAALIDSTVPLEVDGGNGSSGTVDLSLTHVGGRLEPEEPLVETRIPEDLGEEIELPGAGIGISLANVPAERTATVTEKSIAFYPNVAPDTDLAVSPTPSGIETLTQLRGLESPTTETYQLSLPAGAQLVATSAGGAEVRSGEEVLMTVAPPSALDAAGEPVPAELEVTAGAVKVHVEPSAEASFPILVDPLFQTYEWAAKGTTKGICSNSFKEESSSCNNREEWGYEVIEYPWGGLPHLKAGNQWGPAQPGIYVHAEGQQRLNDHATVLYTVPRYFKESPAPTSYIKSLKLSDVTWQALGQYASPYLFMGIWDGTAPGWVSYFSHTGQVEHGINEPAFIYEFSNPAPDTHAKAAEVGIFDTEATAASNATAYVGAATVELGDSDAPQAPIPTTQTQWVNQTAPPLSFTASDTGLGVYAMNASAEEVHRAGQAPPNWKALNGCIGVGDSACQRTWISSEAGHQALTYEPALLPNGFDYVSLVAEDPVGNKSASSWEQVRVDHQSPGLTLSGNLTEQATAGTKLPSYALNYAAADGEEAEAAALAPIGAAGSGEGQLERPQGVAVDGSGNVWSADHANNRLVELDKNGSFVRQVGTKGAADGQINEPGGLTIAPNGNIWVAEKANKRLQEFSPSGGFLAKITNAALVEPYGVAAGPEGTLWVSDPGAHKLFQFKENGTLLRTIVSKANEAVLSAPFGIAVDVSGDVWTGDQAQNKILEYSPTGSFIFSFGGEGTGNGQFKSPSGLAFAPSGNLFVSDEGSRVQEFKPDGTYLRQFGTLGSASNQFKEPRLLALGADKTLYVADAGNHRIDRWTHADQDPQSGAAKVEVKVDGSAAKTEAPGCATKNCQITGSWTLNADSYPVGTHKVEVIATDGVGLTTTKTLNIETHGDLVAPTVALSGSMTQQASLGTTLPSYKLKAVATDTGSADERKSGVASTTIKVDGKVVDSTSPGCPSEGCSITREWTLSSSGYSVGSHNVEVLATDAAGHTTTKTLSITIERDTTAPTINPLSAFFKAPEGWLEQRSYGYVATASDPGGYGATSLQLKIDGSIIKTSANTCSEGGCMRILEGQINMANYSGGAHPAELIATDGAGNVRKKAWTINVDPDGHITLGEAVDTFEAIEETSDRNLIDEAKSEDIDGTEPEIGFETITESSIEANGTQVPTQMSSDLSNGIKFEIPYMESFDFGCSDRTTLNNLELEDGGEDLANQDAEDEEAESGENGGSPTSESCSENTTEQGEQLLETATVTPTATGGAASPPEVINEAAALSANAQTNVDTVVRPLYDGALWFENIRSSEAPGSFSWEVNLEEGETLRAIDNQNVEVFYPDGHPAFGIAAIAASDAIGTTVPTQLSITGPHTVTLNVEHSTGQFVYPISAGAGWQGGFVETEIDGPQDEQEFREEEERLEREERELLEQQSREEEEAAARGEEYEKQGSIEGLKIRVHQTLIGAPYVAEQADSSGQKKHTRRFVVSECYVDFEHGTNPDVPEYPGIPEVPEHKLQRVELEINCLRADYEHEVARVIVRGKFHYYPKKYVWVNDQPDDHLECKKWGIKGTEPALAFCERNPAKEAYGITMRGDFRFPEGNRAFVSAGAMCVSLSTKLYAESPHHKANATWFQGRSTAKDEEGFQKCDWPER